MTWHVGADRLDSYLRLELDDTSASSIEAHLMSCAACRGELAARTPVATIRASWDGLERRIDAAPDRTVDRVLVRLGVPERDVRLIGPTFPIRLSWFVAVATALVGAALLVPDTPRGLSLGTLVFLVLASIVPVAGVAAALGTASDPAPEIAMATPVGRWDLTIRRVVTVLAASILLGLAAGLVLPGPWTRAGWWLCPSLALCALAMVLSGRFGAARAAVGVVTLWCLGVVTWSWLATDRLAPFEVGPQVVYLAIAALLIGLLVVRPDLIEPDGRTRWPLMHRRTR